ncbi:MAG: hypothetical protein NWQ54_15200 [Paraglaciecola sp.]|nr:hypothetical protein [Paraglaciecola sp.]
MSEVTLPNVTLLILLYQKQLDTCSTFLSLLTNPLASQVNVVIWDNGSLAQLQQNRLMAEHYQHDFASLLVQGNGQNMPLSKVYNQVFEQAFQQNGAELVVLLDHDTELPTDYLQIFIDEYQQTAGELLLVPQVRSKKQKLLVSPRRQEAYYLFRRYHLSCDFEGVSAGMQNTNQFFAVASGLGITAKVWQTGLRFEETLQFYGIDTEFCADYASKFSHFFLSNAVLSHDISEEAAESSTVKMWRFEQHMDYWRFQLKKHAPYPSWCTAAFVACYRRLYRLKVRLQAHD